MGTAGKVILRLAGAALLITAATLGSQVCKGTINDISKDLISEGKKLINGWKNR